MLRLTLGLAACLCLCLCGSLPAQAQATEPAPTAQLRVPPGAPSQAAVPRRSRGTHMFLELHAGVPLSDRPAPAGALVFGTGGKLAGTPLRFYFLTEVGADYRRPNAGAAGDGRSLWLGPGVRMYVALFGGLRIFGELTAGGLYVRDSLVATERELTLSGWEPQAGLGAGLQYRFFEGLSLGGRMQYRVLDREGGRDQRFDRAGWTATGSATWHF